MDRRSFLKFGFSGSIATITSPFLFNSCSLDKQPNILFIMSDDHSAKAISAYDGALNQTPNIDRIAENGMRFDKCFCTNAICAPSRAVILTGKHSHINGHIDNSKAFDGSQMTFPKLFQQNGYQTAMIGKWHLVSDPTGFDYWNILPGQGHYYNPDFIEMGEKKVVEGYVTDLITDSALNWLENRDKSKNFCMMLHHKAPHRNWMPDLKYLDLYKDRDIPLPETLFDNFETRSDALKTQEINIDKDLFVDYDFKVPVEDTSHETDEEIMWSRSWHDDYNRMTDAQKRVWDEAYKKENEAFRDADLKGKELKLWKYQRYMKDYLRCIASVDDNIGRVLNYLKESGLDKNTLLFYTSDQGFFLGEHGLFDKRFMYEESLHMPLLVQYPGKVIQAVDDTHLVQNLDFAPTFLDFAGITIPDAIQGMSMKKILTGRSPGQWRDAIYFHFYEYPSIGMVKRHYGIRTDRYKLIHFYHDIDAWELYDLEKDPNELRNVFDDPDYTEVRKRMEQKLADLRAYYKDTDAQRFMPKPVVEIEHLAKGRPVQLKYQPSEKYTGGSPNALTDGLKAPDDLNGYGEHSVWQGFEKNDLDALIDIGTNKQISSVKIGCLHQINAWIFMPLEISIGISKDGQNFSDLVTVKNTVPEKTPVPVRKEIGWNGNPVSARYIRVHAKNRGICPEWHAGAGGKAWIFADEIIVE